MLQLDKLIKKKKKNRLKKNFIFIFITNQEYGKNMLGKKTYFFNLKQLQKYMCYLSIKIAKKEIKGL